MNKQTTTTNDLLEVDNWFSHHDYTEAFKDVFEEMQGAMARIRTKASVEDGKTVASLKEAHDKAQLLYKDLRMNMRVLQTKEEADELLEGANNLYKQLTKFLGKL